MEQLSTSIYKQVVEKKEALHSNVKISMAPLITSDDRGIIVLLDSENANCGHSGESDTAAATYEWSILLGIGEGEILTQSFTGAEDVKNHRVKEIPLPFHQSVVNWLKENIGFENKATLVFKHIGRCDEKRLKDVFVVAGVSFPAKWKFYDIDSGILYPLITFNVNDQDSLIYNTAKRQGTITANLFFDDDVKPEYINLGVYSSKSARDLRDLANIINVLSKEVLNTIIFPNGTTSMCMNKSAALGSNLSLQSDEFLESYAKACYDIESNKWEVQINVCGDADWKKLKLDSNKDLVLFLLKVRLMRRNEATNPDSLNSFYGVNADSSKYACEDAYLSGAMMILYCKFDATKPINDIQLQALVKGTHGVSTRVYKSIQHFIAGNQAETWKH